MPQETKKTIKGSTAKNPFRIVVVESNEALNSLIRNRILQEGFIVECALNGKEGLEKTTGEPTELLLIACDLPDMTARMLIEKIEYRFQRLPHFVSMTGVNNVNKAVEMIQLGAKDNIIKESSFIEFLVVKLLCLVEDIERSEKNRAYYKLHSETEHLAGVGGWLWNVKSDRWIMSKNWMAIHGCTQKYFNTDDLLKLAHPEDRSKILEAFTNTIRYGEPYQLEHRIIREDNGETGYIRSFGKAEMDYKGNVTRVSGAVLDISEQKTARTALQESEGKFRSIFENAALGIFRSRPEGKYEIVNKAFARILGFDSPEKMLNTVNDISELYKYPEDREKIIQEFADKGFVEDYIVVGNHPGKDTVWISINAKQLQYPDGAVYYEGTIQDITDRKIAEEKLKESREEIRKIFENSMDGILLTSPDGSVFSANPAACRMFGRTEEEICEMGREGLVDKEDPRIAEFLRIRKEKGKVNMEITLLREDGSRFPAEVTSAIFKDVYGNEKTSLIMRDTTERNEAEKQLRDSRQRLEILFESAPDAIYLHDMKGRFLEGNHAAEKMLGYTREELIGKSFTKLNLLPPEYLKKATANLMKNMEGKEIGPDEFELINRDGHRFPVEIRAFPVKIQNQRMAMGIVRDISERKKAEMELLQNEKELNKNYQHLEKLNNSLVDIVLTTSPGTREIIYVNQAAENVFGYSREYFINKNTLFLFATKKDYIEFGKKLQDTISKNRDWLKTELKLKRKNGQIFIAEIITSFIREQGEIVSNLNVIRDVSEKIRYQNELIKAKEKAEESDRLKSAFLANMSHEIRTPMNGVLGFTSLLQKPNLTIEQQKNYIDIIHQSGTRMLNTVNDIIDISRIESGIIEVSMSDVNITQHLEYYHSFFKPEAAKKGIELILNDNLPAQEIIVKTDREKFNSIITNLIKNAIKYTNAGSIEIGCYRKEQKDFVVLEFWVKDTGIGIPKSRHDAVFERFIQADIEDKNALQGSGLGLAISKAFVEMLGGEIWLESKEGKGSAFHFTIQSPH